jgi:hypothetical protein
MELDMTRLLGAPRALRAGVLAGAFATLTGAWMAAAPAAAQASVRSAALVKLTELGIREPKDSTIRIIVYATGPARVSVDGAALAPLTDTLRLSSLPAITADVSESDVHIRLLSSGRLKVGGDVTGGRAIHLTAIGRHIVLLRGGVGADTITDPE